MAKKAKTDTKGELESLTKTLLDLVGIDAQVNVEKIKDPEESLHLTIDAKDESGLLIGSHGTTLSALESFLAISLKQKTGEWVRVVLDIGDWRKNHEEYLTNLAEAAAHRARATSEPQHLYNLSPSQRRIIHVYLQGEKDITTESEGEGENRYLVVKKA